MQSVQIIYFAWWLWSGPDCHRLCQPGRYHNLFAITSTDDIIVHAESADHICCMVALVRCGTSRVIRPRPTHLVRGATGHSWGGTQWRKIHFSFNWEAWWTTHCNGKKPHTPEIMGANWQSWGDTVEKSLSNQSIWGGGCGTSRSNGKKPHTSGQGRQKTFTVEQNWWTFFSYASSSWLYPCQSVSQSVVVSN